MPIRGLAWDDEPDTYMTQLANVMKKQHIEITICTGEHEFLSAFDDGNWDFVLLDVFDRQAGKATGLRLAQHVANRTGRRVWYPILLFTQAPEDITKEMFENLPPNAALRGKGDLLWNVHYIREELKQRGVLVDRSKAFVIHNMNGGRNLEFGKAVRQELTSAGFKSITVESSNLVNEVLSGLVYKMNDCGAMIAICAADDELRSGDYQPRQNVLFEIGVALGMGRGPERLIILQQWGPSKSQQAVLPSDLGGLLTIRFETRIEEAFSELRTRLDVLGTGSNA